MTDPIAEVLARQPVMILDGGLATALEAHGFDLNDPLWSARVLVDNPDAIRDVHRDFLDAGADGITTASYQASLPGFAARGIGEAQARDLLRRSVALAVDARDAFWSVEANRAGRVRPLVAASVGPYGAYLADGSEYTGHYGIDDAALYDFHRARWEVLAGSDADLLACETIPCAQEARVLLRLLEETPERWAWVSLSCQDDTHLCDGSSFAGVVAALDEAPNLAAVGVNCTAPAHITSLVTMAREVTDRPVIAYPNAGRRYDPHTRSWDDTPAADVAALAPGWAGDGASIIGGCCGVTPANIAGMRAGLLPSTSR